MKGQKAKIPRAINTGAYLDCVDNTGARTQNRQPCAGIGDVVIVSVKKGTPEMRKQIFKAVIIRQRKEFRRPDGLRVKFEDNAAVIVDDEGVPKGSEVKGPVAREVAERFSKVASAASMIV